MAVRYVIFDLDDTLVHSDAVRRAFCDVALPEGFTVEHVNTACDANPGRPALRIFEALGMTRDDAADASVAFLARLEQLNTLMPTVAYDDADTTLRAVRDTGANLFLSTGSSEDRARRVLDEAGLAEFDLVLGSGVERSKGPAHYDAIDEHVAAPRWTGDAATVGDSPSDMRLAAEHGVPVRIGLDRGRGRDAHALRAAGATHVVKRLADIVPIIAAGSTDR